MAAFRKNIILTTWPSLDSGYYYIFIVKVKVRVVMLAEPSTLPTTTLIALEVELTRKGCRSYKSRRRRGVFFDYNRFKKKKIAEKDLDQNPTIPSNNWVKIRSLTFLININDFIDEFDPFIHLPKRWNCWKKYPGSRDFDKFWSMIH